MFYLLLFINRQNNGLGCLLRSENIVFGVVNMFNHIPPHGFMNLDSEYTLMYVYLDNKTCDKNMLDYQLETLEGYRIYLRNTRCYII